MSARRKARSIRITPKGKARYVWTVVSITTGRPVADNAKWGRTLLFFTSKSAALAAVWPGEQERVAKIAINEVQQARRKRRKMRRESAI